MDALFRRVADRVGVLRLVCRISARQTFGFCITLRQWPQIFNAMPPQADMDKTTGDFSRIETYFVARAAQLKLFKKKAKK
jgi:hypothetical protein